MSAPHVCPVCKGACVLWEPGFAADPGPDTSVEVAQALRKVYCDV